MHKIVISDTSCLILFHKIGELDLLRKVYHPHETKFSGANHHYLVRVIRNNTMDKNEFEAFIELKIHDIISLTIDNEHLNFEEALQYLYESKLYTELIDESTKLWHLSAEKLFDMLKYEKQTNELIFPDYV